MDFERKTVVRAICLNRNPQFRTSKHCPLACVFGISVGVVQNPKLWILEIGSEFRNLDFARTLFRYPYRVIFGISVGGNIHRPCRLLVKPTSLTGTQEFASYKFLLEGRPLCSPF